MDQTAVFFLLTLIGALIASGVIVLIGSPSVANRTARGFFLLCAAFGGLMLIASVLSVSGLVVFRGASATVFKILIFRGWLVIGTAVAAAGLVLLNRFGVRFGNEAARIFVSSPLVLKGLCLSAAIAFLSTEIGKLAHDAEMRQFFLDSGYPVWFLYFVIAAETLGSFALLAARLVFPAAAGLSILMLGAIHTHYRNGDPFSDSLEAFHLLIILACIVVIKLFGQKAPLERL